MAKVDRKENTNPETFDPHYIWSQNDSLPCLKWILIKVFLHLGFKNLRALNINKSTWLAHKYVYWTQILPNPQSRLFSFSTPTTNGPLTKSTPLETNNSTKPNLQCFSTT